MFFNKNPQENSDKQLNSGMVHCPCSGEQGLFITNRHASWAIALAIMCGFFIFISGYFLGQRKVLEQFSTRLEQDSLSDKIYSSLCTLYEVDNEAEVTDNEAEDSAQEQEVQPEVVKIEIEGVHVAQQAQDKPAQAVAEIKAKQYYAPLAGFGSAEHAYAFAQRCTKKNIKVVVKKKPSKSSKGRTHYWYQVVTHSYDDRQALTDLIDTIKRAEHIRDVRIIEA